MSDNTFTDIGNTWRNEPIENVKSMDEALPDTKKVNEDTNVDEVEENDWLDDDEDEDDDDEEDDDEDEED